MKTDPIFDALVEYDKLQILFSQMMEYWLEDVNPPASLVDLYYDQLTEVQSVCSNAKMFERVNRETADFYDKINSQYALDSGKRL
jgi:site-specific DNA-adenine methylase